MLFLLHLQHPRTAEVKALLSEHPKASQQQHLSHKGARGKEKRKKSLRCQPGRELPTRKVSLAACFSHL
jgi:hypothetical protein